MDRFEFYKDLYDREYDRKQELTDNVATPFGVLTVIGGILAYYFQSFKFSDIHSTWSAILFVSAMVPLAYAVYFFAWGMWFLARTFRYRFAKGQAYHALSHAAQLLSYQEGLLTYYRENGESDETAKKEFEEFLINRLSAHAMTNGIINDSRGEDLDWAKRCVLISLVFVVICAVPVGIKAFLEPVKPTKIEIVRSSVNHQQDATSMYAQAKSSPKPQQPPVRLIKEGTKPPVKSPKK
jgi:hypothetical protein